MAKDDAGYRAQPQQIDDAGLPEGDVTVKVEWSTINYKDGLAITGKSPVVRRFPMVPGIDVAATVTDSSSRPRPPRARSACASRSAGRVSPATAARNSAGRSPPLAAPCEPQVHQVGERRGHQRAEEGADATAEKHRGTPLRRKRDQNHQQQPADGIAWRREMQGDTERRDLHPQRRVGCQLTLRPGRSERSLVRSCGRGSLHRPSASGAGSGGTWNLRSPGKASPLR